MNIAIKKPKIKPTEILILSEDAQSFLLYLHYFFGQFKVQEQKKELEPHKIIKKICPNLNQSISHDFTLSQICKIINN